MSYLYEHENFFSSSIVGLEVSVSITYKLVTMFVGHRDPGWVNSSQGHVEKSHKF